MGVRTSSAGTGNERDPSGSIISSKCSTDEEDDSDDDDNDNDNDGEEDVNEGQGDESASEEQGDAAFGDVNVEELIEQIDLSGNEEQIPNGTASSDNEIAKQDASQLSNGHATAHMVPLQTRSQSLNAEPVDGDDVPDLVRPSIEEPVLDNNVENMEKVQMNGSHTPKLAKRPAHVMNGHHVRSKSEDEADPNAAPLRAPKPTKMPVQSVLANGGGSATMNKTHSEEPKTKKTIPPPPPP